ncbi:growth-regulating factor 1-like [Andrographis paniculata]|uniref:growth-regulating factor 1-like n=1 Tax=Andrographis paniculata TaxID=175694 RepID=UPI0021E8AFF1|nr:growth-regulating factor 1-like [Andrographis paniculata]
MMMMMNGGRSCNSSGRFPFTASQWQELEHQALVFKYMVSGMPIPPDLLCTIRRSLHDTNSSSNKSCFLTPQSSSCMGVGVGGWNGGFQMGFGRKIDPEPGRCRRTDGKKWRCSKEAYPDSKYCERHMHRGRNRSRKPVEMLSTSQPQPQPPNAIPITNTSLSVCVTIAPPNKTSLLPMPMSMSSSSSSSCSSLSSYLTPASSEPHFLSPHFQSRPATAATAATAMSQETTTNFFLESYHPQQSPGKGACRNGSMSGDSTSSSSSSWKLAPLTMGSSSPYHLDLPDHHHYYYGGDNNHHHQLQPSSLNNLQDRMEEEHHQSKKVMHHFLDEWPPKEKDWPSSENKMAMAMPTPNPTPRTQLSMSIPNSLHDFFMTQKW